MLISLLCAAAQAGEPATLDSVRAAPRDPAAQNPYAECRCPPTPDGVVEIEGVVKDAELRVGPDGRSVLPTQTTVFTVVRSSDPDVGDEARVSHPTDPAQCGLSFEYGQRYIVRAEKDGRSLKTNWCIDPQRE